jgi:hypothetical protein
MIFAGLSLACSVWAADENPMLAFFIVGPDKIEGGRFIDTKTLPKLGHIAAKPGLVIAQLKEASLIKHAGDRPNILIVLGDKEVDQFAKFTGRNVGKIILLMLGNEPLIAPKVLEKIHTSAPQISLSDKQKRIRILEALKRLVGKPKH